MPLHRALHGALLVSLLLVGTGCSLLTQGDVRCQSDADCPVSSRCGETGVCFSDPLPVLFPRVDAGVPCSVVSEAVDCDEGEWCRQGSCAPLPGCGGDAGAGCPEELHCWVSDGMCRREPQPCQIDADCDDGLFCTGMETCDGVICLAGDLPCFGNEENPFCDETGDACRACLIDADCDNGLFCDGAEACVDFKCVDGAPPCSGDNAVCDEFDDQCNECAVSADCPDDDDPCNGRPTCSVGTCVPGNNPCMGETPVCVAGLAPGDAGVPEGPELPDGGGDGGVSGGREEQVYSCLGCNSDDQCEDGKWCTLEDRCIDGECVYTPRCTGGDSCFELLQQCGTCINDQQCDTGDFCNQQVCNTAEGACEPAPAPCTTPPLTVCDSVASTCRECLQDSQCEKDGDLCTLPVCDSVTKTCSEVFKCDNPAAPFCSGECQFWIGNACVNDPNDYDEFGCFECLDNDGVDDCTDGQFCNGQEVCAQGAFQAPSDHGGSCQNGTPPCNGNTPFCNESQDCCYQCQNNGQCNDGLFCTGTESCNNASSCFAQCVSSGNPCFGATPYCNENQNRCDECTQANQCPNDGQFCTGNRTCQNGTCGFSGNPCGGGTPFCNEAQDRCDQCQNNSHCLGANGACNTTTGQCVQCTQNADCVGAFSVCDVATNQCVECLNDGHCGGGTPACVNKTCRECDNNADCANDGQYCTGTPLCLGNNTCTLSGDPCGGGTPFCNEGQDRCDQCENAGDCSDDGQFCTGTPTCTGGMCGQSGDPCGGGTPYCNEGQNRCDECVNDGHCPGPQVCNNGSCQSPPPTDGGM